MALLGANLAWTTLCLGGFRPETQAITTALTAALLLVHLLAAGLNRARIHPAGAWLLPFLVFAVINVLWVTPVPWLGWSDWIGWAQLLAVFWVVLNGIPSRPARQTLFWMLVTLAAVAVLLACYQRFVRPDWLMLGRRHAPQFIGRGSGSFGIPNSLAALLLLLLPPLAAGAVRRGASAVGRTLSGYLAAVLAFGLFLTISRGAWLALALVLAAWPLWGLRGSLGRRLAVVALVAVALGGVMTVLYLNVAPVRERLSLLQRDLGERSRPILWRGAWEIFEEHRLWGGGAGSFNLRFEKHRPESLQDNPRWAHNDYLNTLSDYGVVGFVLLFGGVGGVVWQAARARRAARPAPSPPSSSRLQPLVAGLAAFATQLFVDFHFKIPALALAFATMAALAVREAWPHDEAGSGAARPGVRWRPMLAGGVALAIAVGFLGFIAPLQRAEALRYGAREAIDRLAIRGADAPTWPPVLAGAAAELRQATELSPRHAGAWADRSYVTALRASVEPANRKSLSHEAEAQARRALAIAPAVPEFWIRLGVALDLQGRSREAGAPYVEALKLAPASALMWYYRAYHLSLDARRADLARAAVEFSLRLDGGNRAAQALRQRLAERSRAP